MIIIWVLGSLAGGTLIYSAVGLFLDRHSIDWQFGEVNVKRSPSSFDR